MVRSQSQKVYSHASNTRDIETFHIDMTNLSGAIHGGATMYLVDVLSTLPLSVLGCAAGGSGHPGVSQAIHTVFHAPANL